MGGNVNALSKKGLRARLIDNGRGDIQYIVADLSPAYFNVGQVLFPWKEISADEFYRKEEMSGHGLVADATALPLKEVNSVVMADVLEHIPRYKLALQEAQRALAAGGNLHLVLPSMYKLDYFDPRAQTTRRRSLHTNIVRRNRANSHLHFFREEILTQLQDMGFTIEECSGLGYLNSFLYLLWSHNKYVPADRRKNKSSWEHRLFFTIRKQLSYFDGRTVDEQMRNEDIASALMSPYLAGERHPLELIYEITRLDQNLFNLSFLQGRYRFMKDLVDFIKPDFDSDSLQGLLREPQLPFLGNSVYIRARKK